MNAARFGFFVIAENRMEPTITAILAEATDFDLAAGLAECSSQHAGIESAVIYAPIAAERSPEHSNEEVPA